MSSAAAPEPARDPTSIRAAARVAELFERHGRMVYGICRAMLRDVHEAEDAAQQVFLSAYKALLGGASVRDPGGWLATIARNECRGRIAAGMRSPLPIANEDLDAMPSSVDENARHDQALDFRKALAALPERQREAVVLRYLYGLRYGEVATALGLSRAATEALLFRARRALRGRLRPVVGTVLVVPLALREELALAIPGFSSGAAGASAVAAGAAGGVLAKLAAGPVGVKVATAAVAVSTVGAVGVVESDRPVRSDSARIPIAASGAPLPSDSDSSRSGPGRGATSDESRDDAFDDSEKESSGSSGGSGSREPSGADAGSGSRASGGDDERRAGSRGSDDSIEDAELTDSSGSGSGRSSDDEGSAGSSGSSNSSGSSSHSGSSGSGLGSGSGEAPDD